MLKVVGASMHKTRIGTYILVGAGMLVIGAFFLAAMERPQYDGTYCATASWSPKVGYEIAYLKEQNDLVNIPKGVARICYKDSIFKNGWAQLELETQKHYPDRVQAYAAGFLEGSLTWWQIYNQWKNTISSVCDRNEQSQQFCDWLRTTLSANYERTQALAKINSERDPYWHHINLYFQQLDGLLDGYMEGCMHSQAEEEIVEISKEDFILLNSAADIQDLKVYYEHFVKSEGEGDDSDFYLPSATMFAKIFKSDDSAGWKVLFGHTSAGSYSSMLRIHKRYKFRYNLKNQSSSPVPGLDISFTGYPGILASTDDFYIIKGKKVHSIVAGVAIKNANIDLWKNASIANAVPLSARVMAANRLADNGKKWSKQMSRHKITGNKQWIIIDLKKVDSLRQKADGVEIAGEESSSMKEAFWICEQLPGYYYADYISVESLESNFTWVGNGLPYFNATYNESRVAEVRDYFKINIPTAAEDANLINLESVDKFLRNLSFRGDLLHESNSKPVPYGNTDVKLFSHDSGLEISDFYAFAGPLFIRQYEKPSSVLNTPPVSDSLVHNKDDGVEIYRTTRSHTKPIALRKLHEPFKWSTVLEEIANQAPHDGHPDEWDFKNVSPKWSWHD